MKISNKILKKWQSELFSSELWFEYPKHYVNKINNDINVCILSPFNYNFSTIALGHLSIYHFINRDSTCPAISDRVFAYDLLLDNNFTLKTNLSIDEPLTSFERQIPLNEFDLICISITTPENILTILDLLRLGGIPINCSERKNKGYPIILAGGPGCSNPEPFSDFFDVFCIGDGCEAVSEIIKALSIMKYEKSEISCVNLFKKVKQIKGLYFPSFYKIKFDGHKIKSILPLYSAPAHILKAKDKENVYTQSSYFSDGKTAVIVPNTGCQFKCAYCIISEYGYREFSISDIIERVRIYIENKIETIIINSATITQHTDVITLLGLLKKEIDRATHKVNFFFGSIRFDEINETVPQKMNELNSLSHTYLLYTNGKEERFLALAPEHGSQSLLSKINRNLNPWSIVSKIELAIKNGIYSFVLYFIVGIKSETQMDLNSIIDLCNKIYELISFYKGRLIIKINPLIPTPGTACQRFKMISYTRYMKIIRFISDGIELNIGAEDYKTYIEIVPLDENRILFKSIVNRADRRAGTIIHNIHKIILQVKS